MSSRTCGRKVFYRFACLEAFVRGVVFFGIFLGIGYAQSPIVTLSPTSLTFSSQQVGTTSSPQKVTLKNTGTAALTINSIAASGDFAQTNTCGSSVAINASCTITVTFTPTAEGTRTGSVSISDNASG